MPSQDSRRNLGSGCRGAVVECPAQRGDDDGDYLAVIGVRGHGRASTLGRDAVGPFVYTNDGYMSAQPMRPDRLAYDRPDTAGAAIAQAAAAEGFLSYGGPHDVDGRALRS